MVIAYLVIINNIAKPFQLLEHFGDKKCQYQHSFSQLLGNDISIYLLFLGRLFKQWRDGFQTKGGEHYYAYFNGFGTFTFFRSYAQNYEQMSYNNYQGIQVTIIAFLIFKIIIAIPTAKIPNTVKKVISRISELSLGIYLASAISDKIVYPKFQELISDMVHRVEYLPVAVMCSFFIALIISWGIDMVYRGLDRATKYIWNLHKSSV